MVVQWLRTHLAMQRTPVQSLVWEDPTCYGTTKSHVPQLLSLCSRAEELQLLKTMYLEPVLRNKRSHLNEKPMHCPEE